MSFTDWRADRCAACGGHGLVPVYSQAGFEGERECGRCIAGTVYVTPHDRLVLYPGGPIVGRDPGRYAALAVAPREAQYPGDAPAAQEASHDGRWHTGTVLDLRETGGAMQMRRDGE